MSDRDRISRIRLEAHRLGREREALERGMLRAPRMLAASLIERHLGTREKKRASPAYYLSWSQGGRTRLRHVPKRVLGRVRRVVEAWRDYRRAQRRWSEISRRMERLWKELTEAQARPPEEFPL